MAEDNTPERPTDPKAQARADKAYGKAMRPWWKKKRWIVPLGLVVLIVVISAAASGGGDETPVGGDDTAQEQPSPETGSESGEESADDSGGDSGPASLPIEDGDWRLDSVRLKDDGLGSFGGTGRVTYTGDTPDGGSNTFTLTVFKGGEEIAVLNGSASDVEPGDTASVQWISQDEYVSGPYKYDFAGDF